MRTIQFAALDPAQVSQYRADGFVVVRQLFPADRIAALDAEADRQRRRTDLIDAFNIRCRWQNDAATGECRFDCVDPVIDLSTVFEQVARGPRLLETVGALYGDAPDQSPGVVLVLAPGDVAFFSGYTPHRSAPNQSSHWRRLLCLSHEALSDGGEQRVHYVEFRGWRQDRYAEYGKTSTFFR